MRRGIRAPRGGETPTTDGADVRARRDVPRVRRRAVAADRLHGEERRAEDAVVELARATGQDERGVRAVEAPAPAPRRFDHRVVAGLELRRARKRARGRRARGPGAEIFRVLSAGARDLRRPDAAPLVPLRPRRRAAAGSGERRGRRFAHRHEQPGPGPPAQRDRAGRRRGRGHRAETREEARGRRATAARRLLGPAAPLPAALRPARPALPVVRARDREDERRGPRGAL
mmetsp:Transcript_28517/g.88417  ORF Transcript_28517/g.88417 Transcript_28517/m.88417 type:complete len:230 (-) Transcript_28517:169-858(-)